MTSSPPRRVAASKVSLHIRGVLRQLLQTAAALPHSGRSFLAHLVGTHRLLVAWRQPPILCAAGLLHSAYATETYPYALVTRARRDLVRSVVGTDAEHLIYAFCTVDRAALWRRQDERALHDGQPLPLPARDGGVVVLRASEIRALVLLECANLAEQCRARDAGPAPWMSSVLAAWRNLIGWDRVFPRRAMTPLAERRAIAAYRRALGHSSRTAALPDLDRAIHYNPFAGEPHLFRALCVESVSEATVSARSGMGLLQAWAVPWDKRLPLQAWEALAMRALAHRGTSDYQSLLDALAGGRMPAWIPTRSSDRVVFRLPVA